MKSKSTIVTIVAMVLTCALSLILASQLWGSAEQTIQPQPTAQLSKYEVGPPERSKLLELVNMERKKVGVKPLKELAALHKSAQYKADDMNKYDYFAHVSPHDKKEGYTYVFKYSGDTCSYASENITDNTEPEDNTTAQAMYSFMHSKSHREAILDARYEYIGFGISGFKVVQHFCDVK